MNRPSMRPPTIEDLLRFKRAEQPSPEFWARFDRELREKQLAAMVERRPWWCAFPRAYVLVARHRLPLAAAAAFAAGVAVLATRAPLFTGGSGSWGGQVAASPAVERPAPAQAELAGPAEARQAPATVAAAQTSERAGPVEASLVATDRDVPSIALVDDVSLSEAGSRFDPVSPQQAGGLQLTPLPASTLLPRGMAELQRSYASRFSQASTPLSEPLARMTPPAALRRSRLLADALPAAYHPAEDAASSSDRQISRLSDDNLYSSPTARRYDLAADRSLQLSNAVKFSIKF